MGRGIAARETIKKDGSGAIFTNKDGESIELYDVLFFPAEGGKYPDDDQSNGKDKVQAVIADWLKTSDVAPADFKMVNAQGGNRAAAISVWKKADGDHIAFGRYATNIRPGALGIQWPNTQFAKETGYSSDDKVTQSENFQLKPSDLFTEEPVSLTQLLKTVNNLPETLPEDLREIIPAMLNAVARGEETYVPDAAKHRAVIEKYVGEYASVVALLSGNFLTGAVDDVEQQVLQPQGASWNDMVLARFPVGTTNALVDSYITTKDRSAWIAVSSKAGRGGGAAASLASVARILSEKRNQFDPKLLRKNAKLIQGINLLADSPAKEGIYKTGKLYEFVNDNDIKVIEYLIKSFDKSEKMLTGNLKKIARGYPGGGPDVLQKTIMHPNYNLGYRLLAGLARKVAEHLNEMDPTTLFAAALAKSSMVQVYAKTRMKGDALAFVEFNCVYPPTFEGTVEFDARTNFFSTDKPKGKMTFKLKG